MKKIIMFFIGMSLVEVIFLSGCQTSEPVFGDTNNVVDTDNDGYPDDEDSFPSDPNFHIKTYIWGPDSYILEPGRRRSQDFIQESNWHFFVINWSIESPLTISEQDQHNITFEVTIPPDISYTTRYYYDDAVNRNLRLPLNESNWGQWNFSFFNNGNPHSYAGNVTLFIEIYLVK